MWEWGTIQQHRDYGLEIKRRDPAAEEGLVIPGGGSVTFKAKNEDEPWPERAARLTKKGFNSANYAELEWRLALKRKREGSPPPMLETERA